MNFVRRESVVNRITITGISILPHGVAIVPTVLTDSPRISPGVSCIDCRTLGESGFIVVVTNNGLILQLHTGLVQTERICNSLIQSQYRLLTGRNILRDLFPHSIHDVLLLSSHRVCGCVTGICCGLTLSLHSCRAVERERIIGQNGVNDITIGILPLYHIHRKQMGHSLCVTRIGSVSDVAYGVIDISENLLIIVLNKVISLNQERVGILPANIYRIIIDCEFYTRD